MYICVMDLKYQIRNARKEAGMNQKDLSVALGISKTTISNWERGSAYPGIETLKKLSKVLKCDFKIG